MARAIVKTAARPSGARRCEVESSSDAQAPELDVMKMSARPAAARTPSANREGSSASIREATGQVTELSSDVLGGDRDHAV